MDQFTYVGMDVHKDTISIAVLRGSEEVPTTCQIPNDPQAIRRFFKRLGDPAGIRSCYEAGPCGFELHRFLGSLGIRCDVIAPSRIPRRPGDRVKTDRRDAIQLVRLLRAGELTAIHVPTPQEEAIRDLVRAREDLRRDIVASGHRLSKFLLRHGLAYREGKAWTQGYWTWLKAVRFDLPPLQTTLDHYILSLRTRLDQRDGLDAELRTLAESGPHAPAVARLRCLKGIDTLTALAIVAEVQDFRRFATAPEFMGFLGLVPSESSTGSSQNRGAITKTGNGHVRRLLVEAAWAYRHRPKVGPELKARQEGQSPFVRATAWKAQLRLHRRYRRFQAKGRSHQLTIVAMAGELAGFVWALMTQAA